MCGKHDIKHNMVVLRIELTMPQSAGGANARMGLVPSRGTPRLPAAADSSCPISEAIPKGSMMGLCSAIMLRVRVPSVLPGKATSSLRLFTLFRPVKQHVM